MNSVERVRHYTTNLKHEAPMRIPEQDPIDNWPKEGKIDFRELILHYRPELPPALNGLSCEIEGGEHVGIVGRTGAGKSSIMYSLFRLQEPSGGYIMIDGVDISKIGLEVLRSNLSIIPQDPTIFSGTIRSNLDPFAQYDDEELWRVLERVHIKQKIQSLPDLLYTRVAENGENFSLGERQLLCLARALCRRNKIILMDEATAQIDTETDHLIQQTITEEFKHCTVITIAHRLETIIEYDKIIVMEAGKIIEVGSPKELAANPASVFANMLTRASSDKLTNSNETNSTISNNSSGRNNNNMNTKPVRPKPKFKIFTAPSKHEKSEAEADLDNINTNDNYNMA
jgi:ABC-type multidrug transport system fused ATPase/permease subunit